MCFGGPSTEPRHQRKRHVVGGTGQRAESARPHALNLPTRRFCLCDRNTARRVGWHVVGVFWDRRGEPLGRVAQDTLEGLQSQKSPRPMSERKVDNLFSCGCRRIS
ncbi:hypothetical protein TcCL_ESM04904 [Trypanosoma cruzi]|nr:hypothetical protein TcCL_ESM04904 [Trypanosoma cruzi]